MLYLYKLSLEKNINIITIMNLHISITFVSLGSYLVFEISDVLHNIRLLKMLKLQFAF